MPRREVKKAIDDLSIELRKTPKETSVLEEMLVQARDGIDRYTPESIQEMLASLQRELDEFEVEHPRVTELINRLMNALSGMGI